MTVWLWPGCVESTEPAVGAVGTRFGAVGVADADASAKSAAGAGHDVDAEELARFAADGSVDTEAEGDKEAGVRPDSSGAPVRPSCSAVSRLDPSGMNSALVKPATATAIAATIRACRRRPFGRRLCLPGELLREGGRGGDSGLSGPCVALGVRRVRGSLGATGSCGFWSGWVSASSGPVVGGVDGSESEWGTFSVRPPTTLMPGGRVAEGGVVGADGVPCCRGAVGLWPRGGLEGSSLVPGDFGSLT
ncbi:hypothetical protein [Streptomyces sp. CA-106110]|uniref:hypothetical protein n=1 Tax=Streptomyces sp. CA-106110 TaxID=3240044 RepID=UPI003D913D3C